MPTANKTRRERARIRLAERRDRIRYIFNRCALELDTAGTQSALSDEFGWHRCTLWGWVSRGEMPRRKADVLVRRFGEPLGFTLDELISLSPTKGRRILPAKKHVTRIVATRKNPRSTPARMAAPPSKGPRA